MKLVAVVIAGTLVGLALCLVPPINHEKLQRECVAKTYNTMNAEYTVEHCEGL